MRVRLVIGFAGVFALTAVYRRITVSPMRTTVSLDDDVFEAAQTLAAASGKNLGKVLSQLARSGLRSSATTTRKNGLPVFKVAPDAPLIPSNRAQKLLADDAT